MRFALVIFLLLFPASPTFAYLDPGSGSLFLQILLASLFGGMLFFKTLWSRIFHVVRRFFTKKNG